MRKKKKPKTGPIEIDGVRGIFIEEEDALKYSKKLWKCVITMGCHIDMVGYLKAFTQLSQTLKIPKEKDDDGR